MTLLVRPQRHRLSFHRTRYRVSLLPSWIYLPFFAITFVAGFIQEAIVHLVREQSILVIAAVATTLFHLSNAQTTVSEGWTLFGTVLQYGTYGLVVVNIAFHSWHTTMGRQEKRRTSYSRVQESGNDEE